MNSYIVDCLEPQPGSFTSTLRADGRPHEHASSGWGGAPLYIQVPYGGLRLTTNSDGPGSRKHTYVRFTCSPPEHLPTSRLHNVIFELESDTPRSWPECLPSYLCGRIHPLDGT